MFSSFQNLTYIYVKYVNMVYSKTALFEQDLQDMALVFKALSHPARLSILRYLAEIKTCITGDISDELPLSRTTVNQHLRELKNTGLIKGTVNGSRVNYCLNNARIKALGEMFEKLIKEFEGGPDNEC